jgi:hypothetical protein
MKGDFHREFRENAGVKLRCVTRLWAIICKMRGHKIIYILILLLTYSCTKKTQQKLSDAEKLNIRGLIVSVVNKNYNGIISEGSIIPDTSNFFTCISIDYFDSSGQIVKSLLFDKDSALERTSMIERDKSGEERSCNIYDSIGNLFYTAKVISSTDTCIKKEITNLDNQDKYFMSQSFNIDGMVYKDYYIWCSDFYRTIFNEYDNKGLLLKSKQLSRDFESFDTIYFSYKYLDFDKNGNWTKRIKYNNKYDSEVVIEERTINYRK